MMSNADKNIVITPNRGSTTGDPRIDFVGANSTTTGQTISLNVLPISNGTLSFEGSAGQLFSITNDLTGTIFSVNDVSGIPSIEVDADGTVKFAEFSGNVLIGTATDNGTDALQVDGSVSATSFVGPLTGNAATATTASNSNALGGLALHAGRNNEANKVVRTQANGYLDTGWINTISGDNGTTVPTRIYASQDGYIRYYSVANFRQVIDVPTRTGGNASGTWGINITGSAASETLATVAARGNSYINPSLGGISIGETFANYDGWSTQLNVHGVGGHSRVNVKTNTVRMGVYAHNSWQGVSGVTPGGFVGTYTNHPVSFLVNTTQRMVINTSGFVGIGTSSPSSLLHVNGTITANALAGTAATGSGASGTWGINITGNAATASNAALLNSISAVNLYNNMGGTHTTRSSFDATTPSYDFGYRFVQGNTNGPGTGGTQFYSWYIGLGTDYPATGGGSYGAMFAVDRNSAAPYLSVRYNEANSFGTWRRISAGRADTLTTARTINNVSFNGSANITLPTVNTVGDQSVGGTKTFTGLVRTRVSAGAFVTAGDRSMSVMGNTTAPAVMTFHRGGAYAVQFGLDTDNHLKMGGWSAGIVRHTWQNNGNYIASGEVTAFSDINLKENIEVIADPLTKILSIRGVTFTRNDQEDKETRHMGVIAQEIEQYFPEVVLTDRDGTKSVNYGAMAGAFIEAIKELASQVSELKKIIQGNQ